MMLSITVDFVFLRLVLPLVLFIVATARYNAFSFVYLLFLLACPLIARPKCRHTQRRVQVYLILLITLSCVFTLSHPTLHIVLAVAPPYENALLTCKEATIAAQIGVQRLNGMLIYRAMRLVLPDIIILSVAVAALVYFSRRRQLPSVEFSPIGSVENYPYQQFACASDDPDFKQNVCSAHVDLPINHNSTFLQSVNTRTHVSSKQKNRNSPSKIEKKFTQSNSIFLKTLEERQRKIWRAWAFDSTCMVLTVLLICFAGITSPSVPSSLYLISFLSVCTYWACRSKMNPAPFASLRIFLLVYSGLHVCLYYLYQFPFSQFLCKDGDFCARLLGLYYIMRSTCDNPGAIIFPTQLRVVDYVSPLLTMLLYYVLVLETRRWLDNGPQQFSQFIFFRHNPCNSAVSSRMDQDNQERNVLIGHPVTSDDPNMEETANQNAHNDIIDQSVLNVPVTTVTSSTPTLSSVRDASTRIHIDDSPRPSDSVARALSNYQQICTTSPSVPMTLVTPIADDITSVSGTEHWNLSQITNPPDAIVPPIVGPDRRKRSSTAFITGLEPQFDALFGLAPSLTTYAYGSTGNNVATERPFLLSLHYSAIRNSYILTLIAMMAWAVVYRSWLSFILLLSACVLWVVPNSRAACLYASPLIVLYAIVLILIQFVYGLNLNSNELPLQVTSGGLPLSELGMQHWEHSVGALALQMGFLVCFWLTLRLFVMERGARRVARHLRNQRTEQTTSGGQSPLVSPNLSHQNEVRGPWARTVDWSYAAVASLNIFKRRRHRQSIKTNDLSLTPFMVLPENLRSPGPAGASAWLGFTFPFGTVDNSIYNKFTAFLRSMCVKYWIVVCCMSMLLVSIQRPVVVFRIVYMLMLIYFMFLFQVSFRFWRRQMLFFWWVNVAYSMGILLCIYTYQFDQLPNLWERITGLSPEILKDLGLEKFESAGLFERLLTPVVFLVVIILQVHYFHEPFLKRSAMNRFRSHVHRDSLNSGSITSHGQISLLSGTPSSSMSNFIEDVNSAFQTVVSKLYSWAVSLSNYCWRFLEIHWIKLVALTILLTAINEVSAPNVIPLVLMVFCFPFPPLHGFLVTTVFIWTGLQAFCKMVFQLNAVNITWNTSCNFPTNSVSSDTIQWLGLEKVDNFTDYIFPLGALMVVTVVWHAIYYRQRQFYNDPRNIKPGEGIVFPSVTIDSMGYDLLNVVKFSCNYGFYKFGLELCHCTTVITACLRADSFSVLYLVLMLIFLFTRRELCARLWLPYLIILAALIPLQYSSCVGLPPALCVVYPWFSKSVELNNLVQWLYLPGLYGLPSAHKLTADFFQFAAVALQYRVFKIEQRPDAQEHGGGSNRPVLVNELPRENDRDFVSSKESYLDYMRHLIFYWSYWVSLAIVLATGVVWITLFCLGYMILSFIYLWMGQNVMLRKRTNLISSWNVIIGYNFCVILAKCSLQLIGCVFWSRMSNQCWLVQLFGVRCMNPMSWNNFHFSDLDNLCATVSSGLHWDVICFIFILFQRKVFMSYSFCHVVLDLNIQSQFASRGAYLINRKLMLAINEQALKEQQSLEKVREKLDRIQQRQEALGRNTANINEHYIMLRSGDYCLFEGDPEEDDELDDYELQRHSSGGGSSSTECRRRYSYGHVVGPREDNEGTVGESHRKNYGLEKNKRTLVSSNVRSGKINFPGAREFDLFPEDSPTEPDYLRSVWPNIESNVLDILSNYDDPFGKTRDEKTYGTTNQNVSHSNYGGKSDSSCFVHNGFIFGHRRMRSHPEYIQRQFATFNGPATAHSPNTKISVDASGHSIVPSSALRSIGTSQSQLIERSCLETKLATHKPVHDVKRKPYEVHRRMFSASEVVTPTCGESSVRGRNPIEEIPLMPLSLKGSGGSPSSPQAGTVESPHKFKPILLRCTSDENSSHTDGTLKPSVQAFTSTRPTDEIASNRKQPVHFKSPFDTEDVNIDHLSDSGSATSEQRTGVLYYNNAQAPERDSEEDDDANPPSTPNSRLNPLQLINRAMELGARSAVRQYRRNFLPRTHMMRFKDQVDSDTLRSNTEPQLTSPNENRTLISHKTLPLTPTDQVEPLEKPTTKGLYDRLHYHSDLNSEMLLNQNNLPKKRNRKSKPLSPVSSVPTVEISNEIIDYPLPNIPLSNQPNLTPVETAQTELSSSSKLLKPRNNSSWYHVFPKTHDLQSPSTSGMPYSESTKSRIVHKKPHFDQMKKFVKPSVTSGNYASSGNLVNGNAVLTDKTKNSYSPCDRSTSDLNQNKTVDDGNDDRHKEQSSDPKSDLFHVDTRRSHEHEGGCWSKFKAACLIAYMFLLSSMDSLIRFLNGLTRQYRRIRRTIDLEKRLVKHRAISNMPVVNEQSRIQLENAVLEIVSATPERRTSIPNQYTNIPKSDDLLLLKNQSSLEQLNVMISQDPQREKAFRQSRSHIFLLLIAIGNVAIVYSEWFCYFLLILNHMRSSNILSLPYPLMVFLWSMLSVPRPTKTFWIFLITYTEVVIVIKYIFQFKFFNFNDAMLKPTESSEALWLPRLFGLDKNDHYALYDLIQLISLFLHRGYLKNNGLWRDYTEFTHDLELIVEENKAAQLRQSSGRRLKSSHHPATSRATPCDNNNGNSSTSRTTNITNVTYNGKHVNYDTRCDDNEFISENNNINYDIPTLSAHYSTSAMSKSWNPLMKLKRFYLKMTDPRYNKKVDVYIYMFVCEFISFLIMIFGYVSFGPSTGMGDNAFEFIKSNRIPFPFISMLLVQFIFIIVDRGLFLRKQVLGKFIFQIFHVLLIHSWLFFVLPHITRSQFTTGFAPQLLYLIKCIYFSLSAYQIRSGYPRRILGNFLTKNYNYLNLILFKGYLIVPFLYELRNVMDWMWTNSALSLYHWMELEDIYAKIFVLKCWRRSELAYPTPRGRNRDTSKKALVGGLLLAFFFLCFWGPMALSSFIGATFDVNPPMLCTFSISFGGFPPTFEFTSREGNIFIVPSEQLQSFVKCHEKDQQTVGFLNNFEWNDLRYITIDGFSGNIWAITPPSYLALLMKLANPESELRLHFYMQCRRSTKEIQSSHTSVEDIFSRKLTSIEKLQLLRVLNSTGSMFPSLGFSYLTDNVLSNITSEESQPTISGSIMPNRESVTLNAVMPRYVLLKKDRLRGAYAQLGQLHTYVNLSVFIHRDQKRRQTWWEMKERTSQTTSDPCFSILKDSILQQHGVEADVLSILTFNERVSDSLFGKVFNNYGIIGMYAAYIFLANRLLRTIYSNISYVIRLEELPHVDRILNLCHEIYLVRESNLLRLEEQLVAKLFFLYRSSETMIKWTRHPKRIVDRFTDKPSNTGQSSPDLKDSFNIKSHRDRPSSSISVEVPSVAPSSASRQPYISDSQQNNQNVGLSRPRKTSRNTSVASNMMQSK